MKNIEKILRDGNERELREVKTWLAKEDLRLTVLQKELDEKEKTLEEDRKSFEMEMKHQQHKIKTEKGRLEQENRMLEQKLKILQQGYERMEEDRRRLQREKDKFNSQRSAYGGNQSFSHHSQVAEMLFSGVNSYLTLKKRYKDLMKMFHPDNVTGDHEMVQIITMEYEELKRAYEMGSQAR